MTGFARHLAAEHFARTGQPGDGSLDGAYQYQMTVLRDMLTRLEVILEDEGVDRERTERVLRCLLYGAPSRADAELRMQQAGQMADLLRRTTPDPSFFPPIGMHPLT